MTTPAKHKRARRHDYPRVYLAMMRRREPGVPNPAILAAGAYKRECLRAAFQAGWFAPHHMARSELPRAFNLLSRLSLAAVTRGFDAREAYDRERKESNDSP